MRLRSCLFGPPFLGPAFLVLMLSGLVACGDKKSAASLDVEARKKALDAVAKELDGAVSGDLAGKLSFESAFTREKSATYVRPKGWKEVFEGNLKAPDGMGFMTSFWVSSNCDGSCTPKDWEATTNKVDFGQFVAGDGKFKVDKDEKSDGQRVLVAHSDDITYIVVTKWKKGASRYFACRADLAKEIAQAAPIFEKACKSVDPLDW